MLAFGFYKTLTWHRLPAAIDWVLFPDRYYHRDYQGIRLDQTPVPCPEGALVIVTGGQSNAANSVSEPVSANHNVPAFQWFEGQCFPLSDPLIGLTDSRGSLWTALGHEIAATQPVVFINSAVGATSYRAWLDRRSGFLARLETSVESARLAGLPPKLILWHQGESDGGRNDVRSEYRSDLKKLTSYFSKMAPEATTILYQASICGNHPPVESLRQAQADVAQAYHSIILGPDTDKIDDSGRVDQCHFNALGRALIVEQTLDLLQQENLL